MKSGEGVLQCIAFSSLRSISTRDNFPTDRNGPESYFCDSVTMVKRMPRPVLTRAMTPSHPSKGKNRCQNRS